jgi:HYR domain
VRYRIVIGAVVVALTTLAHAPAAAAQATLTITPECRFQTLTAVLVTITALAPNEQFTGSIAFEPVFTYGPFGLMADENGNFSVGVGAPEGAIERVVVSTSLGLRAELVAPCQAPPPPGPDLVPPILDLPQTIRVLPDGPDGTIVSYRARAFDDKDPAPRVECSPAAGSRFPIGTTTVTCTATDASGNSATKTFDVVVLGLPDDSRDWVLAQGSAGVDFVLSIQAGPQGESPEGVLFLGGSEYRPTCLRVEGNRATVGFAAQSPSSIPFIVASFLDGGETTGADRLLDFALPTSAVTSCPAPPAGAGQDIPVDDVRIHDAHPQPTTMDDCKDGGWSNFAGFKNEGDCVSFVATGGKNPPAGT